MAGFKSQVNGTGSTFAGEDVVCLDYSRRLVMWRIICRTLRRNLLREPCCNGNYETLRNTFSRDSMVLWSWKTYHERKQRFTHTFQQPQWSHLTVYRFRHPRQAEIWLNAQ